MSRYTQNSGFKPTVLEEGDRFSKRGGDAVTIKSSDNRMFNVKRDALACHAKGVLKQASGGVAFLGEDASTLELLLRIVQQEKGVRLDHLTFPRLLLLADAAERYEAFAASEKCCASMKSHSASHTLEVMRYAAKYGYLDILDAAAASSVGLIPAEVSRVLPANERHFAAWVFYIDQYNKLLRQMTQHQYANSVCAS